DPRMSATLKESPAPGRHWTPPMDGSKSSFQTNPGPAMTILRLRIAPLRRRFSMPIGCTQSATGSRVFAPTALGFLLDHLSRARLMRRDHTASYSLRVLRIETDELARSASVSSLRSSDVLSRYCAVLNFCHRRVMVRDR